MWACTIAGIFFGLGLFTVVVFLGWEDDRARPVVAPLETRMPRGSAQYETRVRLQARTIETVCAYCRCRTVSQWCGPCRIYHCTAHQAARYSLCTLAWRPHYAKRIGSRHAALGGSVAPRNFIPRRLTRDAILTKVRA